MWAKSGFDRGESSGEWLPLWQHLDDTAGIASLLVREWLSPLVIARVGREVGGGVDRVVGLAQWLAGVHDVGKASPAFAVQAPELTDRMRPAGLVVDLRLRSDPARGAVSHALVGHVAVRAWLRSRGFGRRVSDQLGSIVGSHHGATPEVDKLLVVDKRTDLAGGDVWVDARNALLSRAAERISRFDDYAALDLSLPTQVLLTGVVIVADWIASNPDLFPLWPVHRLPGAPNDEVTAARVAEGWDRLALPRGWRPPAVAGDLDAVFRARFGKPSMRPVQRAAVSEAIRQAEPWIVVIEAPMGSGKTEAALLAAEVLAHRSGADGCFVALPTQATSDAMFTRVRHWLDRLPGQGTVSVTLAHGKAHLNDEYSGLVHRGRYSGVGEVGDDGAAIAHQWLSGRKKSGLASFVVGTIDQVLFAGLRSRHLMLRHLALAGKVVIIDEVHAYDVYMSRYLHRVLHWLGAYGVPVVLLSATLPDARRVELVRAYAEGRGVTPTVDEGHPGYPAVTSLSGSTVIESVGEPTVVRVDRLADDLDTLVRYLKTCLADGGCAVVVRNTVTRVQDTARRLAEEFGADAVTIAHSRFLACDRAAIDRSLVRRFGPPGADRPASHIVVASQVVEQSLDIDFDLMVTDLAPVDLVLQRLGRLQRHDRARPTRVRTPRCAVVGVEDWGAAPVVPVSGSRRVYGDHMLLRSAALLIDRDTIMLPDDIAPLVQAAYGSAALGPASWQPAMHTAAAAAEASARQRTDSAGHFLLGRAVNPGTLVGWLVASAGDARDEARGTAQVRDGEESLEVLVVQRDADGGLLLPDWIDGGGQQIPLYDTVSWAQAKVISACSLRLPMALSHGGVVDAVIAELERTRITSFDLTPLLTGQLVLVLDRNRQAVLHGYRLTYDPRRGLLHEPDQ
ncbi:CRISPR-associated helicase Cas3' [Actinokineospora cianjurensis]|uniref:CRISPR-associated helicase Cas3' n=1 Tax=Actinokineospora cianjurensis TaxID=585224 RepID=UPI001FE6D8EF|nr:CRISPR-associated helicase Cas3' [Actinokineospora cianjurensis]